MKKCWIILLIILLFTGCGQTETLETVQDVCIQPVSAPAQQILLELPKDAAVPALQSEETGLFYDCGMYTVTVQTLPAGDLDKTVRTVSGFSVDALALMQTQQGNCQRYTFVWSAAGEGQQQVGRACILDDGNFHYVVTAMAPADSAGDLAASWQALFSSLRVVSADAVVSTGS